MGVYMTLYSILQEFLYGAESLTPHMEFVLTELATLGCIAAVAVPFLVVWCVIRAILGVFFNGT